MGNSAPHIEIGLALRSDRWAGADFWEQATDDTLTLDGLLERSEVVVMDIDGGGLHDLLGLALRGREKGTRSGKVPCVTGLAAYAWRTKGDTN